LVALIVGLKWQLLRNGLRRSTPQLVGLVLGGLYGLGVLSVGVTALVGLRFAATSDTARIIVTIGGSGLTLGWALFPIFSHGVDDTLDPVRFATFAVPRRQLVLGMLVASLVGVPAAVTSILALATVFTWSRSVLALVVALVAVVVAVLTCVALSRVTSTAFSALSRHRKGKERISIAVLMLSAGLGVVGSSMINRLSTPGLLAQVADVLGWTPLGLAWSAPADIVAGATVSGLVRLMLAAIVLVASLVAWDHLLCSALENPHVSSGDRSSNADAGLVWFARLPNTPTGAVAARSIGSWRRDPRYLSSIGLMLLLPLGLLIPPITGGSLLWSLLMSPVAGFLLGWSMHNDVAYDGTAFWLHVATGVSGRADRLGRLVPTLLSALFLLPAYASLGCALNGRWGLWPALLGIGLGLLLTGFGVASVMSALQPYPVPGPGENPFGAPPGSSALKVVLQAAAGAAVFLINIPLMVLGIAAFGGNTRMGWLCLGLAVVSGSWQVALGTWWGARIYERRAPELLAELSRIR